MQNRNAFCSKIIVICGSLFILILVFYNSYSFDSFKLMENDIYNDELSSELYKLQSKINELEIENEKLLKLLQQSSSMNNNIIKHEKSITSNETYLSYLKKIKSQNSEPWHQYIATTLSDKTNSTQGSLRGVGGEWNWCTHIIKYGPNFDRGFATFLSSIIRPKSALEVGSGIGLYINYVQHYSNDNYRYHSNTPNAADLNYIGVEPESMLNANIYGNKFFGKAVQLNINLFEVSYNVIESIPQYDLVYSSEVAEHIPNRQLFGRNIDDNKEGFVDFLVNKTRKFLVFGAARKDQGGTGHLYNSMWERKDWEGLFVKKGMIHLKKLSQRLRDFCYNDWDKKRNTFIMASNEFYNKNKNIENILAHLKNVQDIWPDLQNVVETQICQ